MNNEEKLAGIRKQIDALDEQIQELINARAECAQQVAEVKHAAGEAVAFYRPEREADILRTIQKRNKGPLSNEVIARLFREIISACLALEQVLKIAFLGPEGTFTQAATRKHFGQGVETVPQTDIDDVFREVESGHAHYGVVPIENSTEGVVNHTLDMFMSTPLKICGEVELRIHHHLISLESDLSAINRIYSHQQSLGQCRKWLDAHLPETEAVAVSSNAEAAKLAADDPRSAAIASDSAAEIYGLEIIADNIEDEPDNTTRFLILGRDNIAASGHDKTSILCATDNRVGSLHHLLAPLVKHKVSMTRIESRPSRRGMWDYVFFIDMEGHISQPGVSKALDELQQDASLFKVLGSYPRAVL
jgi:chorismate mutase/prephenate dehydratase